MFQSPLILVNVFAFTLFVAMGSVGTGFAQSDVDYANRGNRFEGVRKLPVAGYTIALLSAQAIHRNSIAAVETPPMYRMRFFLDRLAPAFVVIREVDNRHSYWLDKVKPPTPWRPGFENVFEWPTAEVVRKLSGLKLENLGVTVRIGYEHPSDLEAVAPAILYYSDPPDLISGYEFAFKTNVTARLEFSIEESDGRVVRPPPEPRVLRKWSYGVPIRVTWNAATARAGEYRLKVRGRVLENNDTFAKEVRFFHQPRVR